MKYLISIIIFVFSLLFFLILEYGKIPNQIMDTIHPLVFSAVTTLIFLRGSVRNIILKFCLILLFLMVILYLFNAIGLSEFIGSLGFGILAILIFSQVPKLIKDGHI